MLETNVGHCFGLDDPASGAAVDDPDRGGNPGGFRRACALPAAAGRSLGQAVYLPEVPHHGGERRYNRPPRPFGPAHGSGRSNGKNGSKGGSPAHSLWGVAALLRTG